MLRAQFSCCTSGEVKKALRTLRPLNMGMVNAVEARIEIDLRLGKKIKNKKIKIKKLKYKKKQNH